MYGSQFLVVELWNWAVYISMALAKPDASSKLLEYWATRQCS